MQATQVVPAAAQRRERWRNGAGWTREILAAREGGADAPWTWRISIAEIDADAPFSSFASIDRELVLLSGNGLRLRFDDGEVAELSPPHDRIRFAGERAVSGELLEGPATGFNLMWRRDAVAAQSWLRPLAGSMIVFVDPGTTWMVHVLAGRAMVHSPPAEARTGLPPLAAGDTVVLAARGARTRYALDGGGEALVIRISECAVTRRASGDGPGTASSR